MTANSLGPYRMVDTTSTTLSLPHLHLDIDLVVDDLVLRRDTVWWRHCPVGELLGQVLDYGLVNLDNRSSNLMLPN